MRSRIVFVAKPIPLLAGPLISSQAIYAKTPRSKRQLSRILEAAASENHTRTILKTMKSFGNTAKAGQTMYQ